jgi:phospholipase C
VKRIVGRVLVLLAVAAAVAAPASAARATRRLWVLQPIKHVVVLFQENNSFDQVLGKLCVEDERCDGATSGLISTGQRIPLQPAPDISPGVNHSVETQTTAMDGGLMDDFDQIIGCTAHSNYACYEQYDPSQIPNLAALARAFVISDRTFEDGPMPSWGSHLVLVAAQTDGFTGDNPHPGDLPPGVGWGCDSLMDAPWVPPGGGAVELIPSCIPAPDGSGPYRPSPAQWIPTIMDRMDAAGLSWQIDAGFSPVMGSRSICPSFAECLFGPQRNHVKYAAQVITDGQNGTLPNLSLVMPCCGNSQHNSESMQQGDNWIGQVVGAIMNGPDWLSTAIFITYDDCGCFYDHVPPPDGLGIRVPMVIVSPWVKSGYTDSNVATFSSMLAFTEHVFGLAPLSTQDAGAYDYQSSFTFAYNPSQPMLRTRPLSRREKRWLKLHPADPNDPT